MHKLCQLTICAAILGAIALRFGVESVSAQGMPSSAGSIFPSPNDTLRHHMGPTGKPCLTIGTHVQPQTLNPHIVEHWVGASNSCGKNIKVQVCYYGSQDCITMDVPPYGRQDSVLGIYPALADFRIETKEQF
jgi:hypothetical protein